jgi:hypothetical protein
MDRIGERRRLAIRRRETAASGVPGLGNRFQGGNAFDPRSQRVIAALSASAASA